MADQARPRGAGVERAADNRPAKVTPKTLVIETMKKHNSALTLTLPKGWDGDRFQRVLINAGNQTPKLFECDPMSFLMAGIQCAQLGLEPNDQRGLAYLVPFGGKVQTIIGYRGYMDLARRSGMVTTINAEAVYASDKFTYEKGLHPTLTHVPDPNGEEDPEQLVYTYAVAGVRVPGATSADPQFTVLSRVAIDKVYEEAKRKAHPKSWPHSPWNTQYPEMGKKTAIRRLAKYLPMSVEMAAAVALDDSTQALTHIGDVSLVDAFGGDYDDFATYGAIEAGTTGGGNDGEGDAPPPQA